MGQAAALLEAVASGGNPKIGTGPSVGAFSMAPGTSCPGATAWCAAECYAKSPFKRYAGTTARWTENEQAARAGKMPRISPSVKIFRLHVSGDFFSAPYIRAWIRLVRMHPDVKFWGYTRSWRVGRLAAALEQLRDQPNVQLFASVDTSSELAPDGWRVAFIEGDHRFDTTPSLACPEQAGTAANCKSCGFCFRPAPQSKANVRFTQH